MASTCQGDSFNVFLQQEEFRTGRICRCVTRFVATVVSHKLDLLPRRMEGRVVDGSRELCT